MQLYGDRGGWAAEADVVRVSLVGRGRAGLHSMVEQARRGEQSSKLNSQRWNPLVDQERGRSLRRQDRIYISRANTKQRATRTMKLGWEMRSGKWKGGGAGREFLES